METKKKFFLTLLLMSLTSFSNAYATDEDEKYPEIYPFVPFSVQYIYQRVQTVSEDRNFERNIYKMNKRKLTSAKTKVQPWTSTYWPLNKGLIADPYIGGIQIHRPGYELSWSRNYSRLSNRQDSIQKKINELTQEQLNILAPSEKYDILIGDYSFDLTKRLVEYMGTWGSQKEYGFLTMLDKVGGRAIELARQMVKWGQYNSVEEAIPQAIELRGGLVESIANEMVKNGEAIDFEAALAEATKKAVEEQDNYVLKRKNRLMALWEGICHGWATAAGIVPRPRNTVSFNLPTGKKLNFYPDDIKGLVSLLWANSLIQDSKYEYKDNNGNNKISGGVIMQGLRCNDKSPKKDEWGRFYDSAPDYYSKKLEPRCVGVHPAIWHMGIVNILGIQGRSFIVERKVKAAVDNHPMSSYTTKFFHPNTGDYGTLAASITKVNKDDQFLRFRNPGAKYIVGVKTTMTYLDWERPRRALTDSKDRDSLKSIDMLYDLELDAKGNIVGGQWRSTEVGKNFLNIGSDRNQPDFFWVITKHWKKTGYFNEFTNLSQWRDLSSPPPADWKKAAFSAHSFMYKQTHAMGWNEKCEIIHKRNKDIVEVPCEFITNRPQPLINVVNKLVDLSRK